MTLRLIGAGVGRTGTESLKVALEHLLGGPCYHMLEVVSHPEAVTYWAAAGRGDMPDWDQVFDGYVAAVDWPVAAYWRELSAAFPDAPVLLSTRASAEEWYRSASQTIFALDRSKMPGGDASFIDGIFSRFTPELDNPQAAMEAYEAHNRKVHQSIEPGRLVEWKPGDGWTPLCEALGVPEPEEPFPHQNTTEMFRRRLADFGVASREVDG
jgi:Sulfotransferase domain